MWVAVAAGVVIIPSPFGWLLFGAELLDAGQALGRLTEFTLLSLVLACWPRLGAEKRSAVRALLAFSLLSAFHLIYLGIGSRLIGPLLWPAAALHAVLTIILFRVWLNMTRRTEVTGPTAAIVLAGWPLNIPAPYRILEHDGRGRSFRAPPQSRPARVGRRCVCAAS
jgi:hypothetical protein